MSTGADCVVTHDLLEFLKRHYRLDWNGTHGVTHWSRVRANGLALARTTGANTPVVELFAFLHDSCREHERYDDSHGIQAGKLAEQLQGRLFILPRKSLQLLIEACEGHTVEHWHRDITVATCWDADRLDLFRVGIRPSPDRMLTIAAKYVAVQLELIESAGRK